jgi:UPF0755 protein
MDRHRAVNKRPLRPWHKVTLAILVPLTLLMIAFAAWFGIGTMPVSDDDTPQTVVIEEGAPLNDIAHLLAGKQLIRDPMVFQLYVRLSGQVIMAGSYSVAPNMSVGELVKNLSHRPGEISVMIPPGLTLAELRNTFKKYGYTDAQITAAYNAEYDYQILSDKPASADLEGYIFPDTYNVFASDPLSVLIGKAIDELGRKVSSGGLEAQWRAQNLNNYQAITLASIVQREVSDPTEQKRVAGVFLNRMRAGMHLGSDVTFIYAAKQLGVTPSSSLDSPYNTRRYVGLPPGPIANMQYSALEAVADPTRSGYYYFIAGDDGRMYYAATEQQHLDNIARFCQQNCR